MLRRLAALTVALSALAVAISPLLLRAHFRRRRGSIFETSGTTLHYERLGDGPPVVLLHGFAVNSFLNWRLPGITTKLAQEFQVIMLDLRGHGASGRPATYGAAMADDVVRLLDHLGLDRAHLVGYSLGGVIALKVAATYPERVISVSPLGSGWENPDDSVFLGSIDEIAEALAAGRGVGPLAGSLGGEERERPGVLHTAWVRFMTAFLNDGPALAEVVRGLPELTIEEDEVAALAVPVCSIVGERDAMRPGADALRGRAPDLVSHVIDDADHITATASPELASALRAFLLEHSAQAVAA